MDYGEGPMVRGKGSGKYRRPRLFVLTLGYSGKSVGLIVARSSTRTWVELHERAFRQLGGHRGPSSSKLREGVAHPDVYDPTRNPLFRNVLAHYGVVASPCSGPRPRSEGQGRVGRGPPAADLCVVCASNRSRRHRRTSIAGKATGPTHERAQRHEADMRAAGHTQRGAARRTSLTVPSRRPQRRKSRALLRSRPTSPLLRTACRQRPKGRGGRTTLLLLRRFRTWKTMRRQSADQVRDICLKPVSVDRLAPSGRSAVYNFLHQPRPCPAGRPAS